MAEAVIVEAVRSPVGKRNGGLSGVHPAELSAQVLNGLAERAGIDPEIVDDVIWGCVMQAGEQALDIARTAVLTAGWPETIPGVTVDRQCGSSQQSVHFAAAGVVAGHYDAVIAGGVESMSRTPMGASLANGGNPYSVGFKGRYKRAPNQGVGAEMMKVPNPISGARSSAARCASAASSTVSRRWSSSFAFIFSPARVRWVSSSSGKKREVRRITIGRPCSAWISRQTCSAASLVTP